MTSDEEDRSTWARNKQVIRRDELLRLIEENGGPRDLDLRGAVFVGDGPQDNSWKNPVDLSDEALAPLAEAYRKANGGSDPPWLDPSGAISLRAAQLQEADLSYAQLQEADLSYAQLQGADFGHAKLQDLDLYDVKSLEGARWYGAVFDHTRIKGEHLGKAIGDELTANGYTDQIFYDYAREAYLLLKNNFNQIGRYEDASWAYVKEQQMERKAYYGEAREHGWPWGGWGAFRGWLRNWAYEVSTGYGERPWNAVGLGAFIMAAFALVFWATSTIGNFWDALIYSLATFATFNLGPSAVDPEGRGFEIFSSIEALLGIAILALVVFTLGNRMSRG